MKLGFFPYSSLYYKGAQEYLDKKAAKGLELRQVYLGCIARFEEAEKPRHFVDLESAQEGCDDPMRTYRDYFQLCEDAGWELVRELRQAARLNVNQGQLAGWLCAGMFV